MENKNKYENFVSCNIQNVEEENLSESYLYLVGEHFLLIDNK